MLWIIISEIEENAIKIIEIIYISLFGINGGEVSGSSNLSKLLNIHSNVPKDIAKNQVIILSKDSNG